MDYFSFFFVLRLWRHKDRKHGQTFAEKQPKIAKNAVFFCWGGGCVIRATTYRGACPTLACYQIADIWLLAEKKEAFSENCPPSPSEGGLAHMLALPYVVSMLGLNMQPGVHISENLNPNDIQQVGNYTIQEGQSGCDESMNSMIIAIY